MKCEKYVWLALVAITFLGTTGEARTRNKVKKAVEDAVPHSDDPNPVQNQQPDGGVYDEYTTGIDNGDYDYSNYDENQDNGVNVRGN